MISAPKKETFSLLFSCSNWIMFGRVKQERCTHMLYKHLVRENWKICSVRAVDNGREKSKLWKRIKEAFVSFYFHLPLIFLLTIEKQIHTHTQVVNGSYDSRISAFLVIVSLFFKKEQEGWRKKLCNNTNSDEMKRDKESKWVSEWEREGDEEGRKREGCKLTNDKTQYELFMLKRKA